MTTSPMDRARRASPVVWWLARAVLVTLSVVALLSFGGQLFFAPFLAPLQWMAARRSGRAGRILFTSFAALLVGEVGWMIGYVALGETFAVVVGLATALLTAAAFHVSSAPRC